MEKVVEPLDPDIEKIVSDEFRRALDRLEAGDKKGAAAIAQNAVSILTTAREAGGRPQGRLDRRRWFNG